MGASQLYGAQLIIMMTEFFNAAHHYFNERMNVLKLEKHASD